MGKILFIAFMAFLIKINTDRWWLYWFLIMGLAVQCGYKVGMVGVAVWMIIGQILKDIFYTGRRK